MDISEAKSGRSKGRLHSCTWRGLSLSVMTGRGSSVAEEAVKGR
jgi:hypothetical protein